MIKKLTIKEQTRKSLSSVLNELLEKGLSNAQEELRCANKEAMKAKTKRSAYFQLNDYIFARKTLITYSKNIKNGTTSSVDIERPWLTKTLDPIGMYYLLLSMGKCGLKVAVVSLSYNKTVTALTYINVRDSDFPDDNVDIRKLDIDFFGLDQLSTEPTFESYYALLEELSHDNYDAIFVFDLRLLYKELENNWLEICSKLYEFAHSKFMYFVCDVGVEVQEDYLRYHDVPRHYFVYNTPEEMRASRKVRRLTEECYNDGFMKILRRKDPEDKDNYCFYCDHVNVYGTNDN